MTTWSAAHTPKINWKVDEDKALDILTVISFAHKYLDECHKMPGKYEEDVHGILL